MNKEIAEQKESELVPQPASAEMQTLNALTQSITTGQLQPEQLSMILDAQERILDRQAKQEFAAAMAACQAEIPAVLKNRVNDQTRSSFEDLGSLNKSLVPVYSKHGFGVSFDMGDSGNPEKIRIVADVSHRAGWVKQYHYDLEYDMYGLKGNVNKTKIHGSSSSVSYGRRYLLKMLFNITTADEIDNDGNTEESVETLTENEIANIESLIKELGIEKAAFLKIAKKDSIEEIHRDRYKSAVRALEAKRKA